MKCERCQIPDESPAVCVHMSGSKGGRANRDARLAVDPDYFKKIGSKGGTTVKTERGAEFFREIGRAGGTTTRDTQGDGFYEKIGKLGGDKVMRNRGSGHYRTLGEKGGRRMKDLINLGRSAEKERKP